MAGMQHFQCSLLLNVMDEDVPTVQPNGHQRFLKRVHQIQAYVGRCMGQISSDRVRGGAMGSRLRLCS